MTFEIISDPLPHAQFFSDYNFTSNDIILESRQEMIVFKSKNSVFFLV
mgnify:CR=1 FL=1